MGDIIYNFECFTLPFLFELILNYICTDKVLISHCKRAIDVQVNEDLPWQVRKYIRFEVLRRFVTQNIAQLVENKPRVLNI